jgi:hypothetical protein
MPQYAQFDSTTGPPYPVIGWFDTDENQYLNLPISSSLILVNTSQWANRINSGYWDVLADGVTLVASTYPATIFNLSQQASLAFNNGLTISLSGTLTLDSTTFPIDSDTQTKITAVVTTISATGDFPGNVSAYPMKDSSGAWHTLTITQYQIVAGAIAGYVSMLNLIADGNPFGMTQLPAASISLVV